jgi:hypothetical protein
MPSSTTDFASNMVPKYEVKLLMDPDVVLDSNKKLDPTVLDTFEAATTVLEMKVQFLDTDCKAIYEEGWSPRIRKVQNKADLGLTYKKRYTIVDGDVDTALATASKDGFDSTTDIYEAQVDWGYTNQTLSINHDNSYSGPGSNTSELPNKELSREMLIEKAPEKFNHSVRNNWGTEKLKESRIFGPVPVERYTGDWSGEEMDIEVWPIKDAAGTGTEYIVEVSFKVKKRTKAAEKRDKLMTLLETKGWLLERDSLKTTLIMERY